MRFPKALADSHDDSDAVWVTKEQVNLYKDGKGIQEIVKASMESEQAEAMYGGENLKEGLKAFVEVLLFLVLTRLSSHSCYRNEDPGGPTLLRSSRSCEIE